MRNRPIRVGFQFWTVGEKEVHAEQEEEEEDENDEKLLKWLPLVSYQKQMHEF